MYKCRDFYFVAANAKATIEIYSNVFSVILPVALFLMITFLAP